MMRFVFLSLFGACAALALVARSLHQDEHHSALIWATDANPVRTEQMLLFRRAYPELDIDIDPANSARQKIIVQSIGGVGPDCYDSGGTANLAAYVQAGIAKNLSPIVDLHRRGNVSLEDLKGDPVFRQLFEIEKQRREREREGIKVPSAEALTDLSLDRRQLLLAQIRRPVPDSAFSAAELKQLRQRSLQRMLELSARLDYRRVWPVAWSAMIFEGKQYAFPCNVWMTMIVFHKDVFAERGVPYPKGDWSWNQFLTVAKKLTYTRPDGEKVFGILSLDWRELVGCWGGECFNETATKCLLDSPEAVAAVQFYLDLQYKHHVMPTPAEVASMSAQGGWGGGAINQFAAKYCAMTRFGRYGFINWRLMNDQAIQKQRESGQPIDPPLKLGVAPQPYQVRKYYLGGSRVAIINANSPRADQAVLFLDFLGGKEYGRQINWSADCVPGPIELTRTKAQMSNPTYPEEHEYDPLWRTELDYCCPFPFSPFLTPFQLEEIQRYHWDLIYVQRVTPQEGLAAMAFEINAQIEKNLAKDPRLAAKYHKALARQKEIDRLKQAGRFKPTLREQSAELVGLDPGAL